MEVNGDNKLIGQKVVWVLEIRWPNCVGSVVRAQHSENKPQRRRSDEGTGISQYPLRIHPNLLQLPNSLTTSALQTKPTHIPTEDR